MPGREGRKLLSDGAEIAGESPVAEPEKATGKQRLMCLADLDGRTKGKKIADATFSSLLSDAGGEAQVSAGQRALLEHCSVLNAMAVDQGARYLAREPVDAVAYCTVLNTLRRLLESAGGLTRVPKDVTDIHGYLASVGKRVAA